MLELDMELEGLLLGKKAELELPSKKLLLLGELLLGELLGELLLGELGGIKLLLLWWW